MKKLIFIAVMLMGITMYAQSKNAKASLKVNGVCLMCKARIEKASLKTKGVKSAIWNVDTHELKLIYDERKTDLSNIENRIVAVGHDTENLKASDEVYESIDACCHYRDQAVIDSH